MTPCEWGLKESTGRDKMLASESRADATGPKHGVEKLRVKGENENRIEYRWSFFFCKSRSHRNKSFGKTPLCDELSRFRNNILNSLRFTIKLATFAKKKNCKRTPGLH